MMTWLRGFAALYDCRWSRPSSRLVLAILLFLTARAGGHAPILPPIQGPVRTLGNLLIDATGAQATLRGVHMPGLETGDPEAIAAMDGPAFGVIRLRWNMNAVRLPVSVALWRRDGQAYLDRVASLVRLANDSELLVVLAACEDEVSGTTGATGLPTADTLAFWRAWAAHFKDNPLLIFSLFRRPSTRNVPGATQGQRRAEDWRFWRAGGIGADGSRVFGMQDLVGAIRAAGARQVIAVPAFHDAQGFSGFTADLAPRGENLLYELHPYFDFGLTDAERDSQYGSLSAQFPFYAGEWGLALTENRPGCTNLPRDPERVTSLLYEAFSYFDRKATSWTMMSFRPDSLIRDFTEYQPTLLDRPWTCGQTFSPQPGMGELLALWTTGDPTGFGVLRADQIASTAGGPAGPIAPGQLVSIYVEQLGPLPGVAASLDAQGRIPVNLAGTQVFFDGEAAPVLYAGSSQINVQAPYSLAGRSQTSVRATYGRVPSNRVTLDVVDAAPELFQDGSRTLIALNQDGARNSINAPARPGSIVVLFGTGAGPLRPEAATGVPASAPHPVLTLPVTVTVNGRTADVLFAGEVPGFVGLVQFNVRLAEAAGDSAPRLVPVTLNVGGRANRGSVFLWLRAM